MNKHLTIKNKYVVTKQWIYKLHYQKITHLWWKLWRNFWRFLMKIRVLMGIVTVIGPWKFKPLKLTFDRSVWLYDGQFFTNKKVFRRRFWQPTISSKLIVTNFWRLNLTNFVADYSPLEYFAIENFDKLCFVIFLIIQTISVRFIVIILTGVVPQGRVV